MGENAARFLPWPSGKDSKGNRLGIGFLWRAFFPRFLSPAGKKSGRRRHRRNGPHRLRNRGYRKGRDPSQVFGHSSSSAQSESFGPRYGRNDYVQETIVSRQGPRRWRGSSGNPQGKNRPAASGPADEAACEMTNAKEIWPPEASLRQRALNGSVREQTAWLSHLCLLTHLGQ